MLVQRRCVACRQLFPQSEMLRIARINNDYHIDEKNKLGGRGASICKNPKCFEVTIKKRLLNRSFKANISAEIYEKLGVLNQTNRYEKNN